MRVILSNFRRGLTDDWYSKVVTGVFATLVVAALAVGSYEAAWMRFVWLAVWCIMVALSGTIARLRERVVELTDLTNHGAWTVMLVGDAEAHVSYEFTGEGGGYNHLRPDTQVLVCLNDDAIKSLTVDWVLTCQHDRFGAVVVHHPDGTLSMLWMNNTLEWSKP